MKYLLIEDKNGKYTKDKKRYNILECNEAIGPRADCFKEYKNLNNAIRFFGLTKIED